MMPAMGTRIADTIRERIEQMIVTGEFADGERLDEVKLAEQFGVSRTPLREAFQSLAASGLLTLEALAARPVPYVTRLPRRPREQQPRWAHLLDGRSGEEAVADWGDGESSGPTPVTSSGGHAPRPAPVAADPDLVDELQQRVAELETQVDDLLRRIERLEGR